MSGATGNHSAAVVWSVAIHVALAAALTLGIRWPTFERPPPGAPIQATLVDPKALTQRQQQRDREQQRKEQQARDAVEQKQRVEEQQKQREKDAVEKREQQRVADEQKKRDVAEQKQREKDAAAKVEKERVAQQQRDKEAADKKARDDAVRKQREAAAAAKAQADAAAAQQRELEAENARRADMLDKYITDIGNAIERAWVRPATAQEGLDCTILVTQVPGGVVADARVDVSKCNGDEIVQRSIEAAVNKASPLPKPDDPRMFDRKLNVRFRPRL